MLTVIKIASKEAQGGGYTKIKADTGGAKLSTFYIDKTSQGLADRITEGRSYRVDYITTEGIYQGRKYDKLMIQSAEPDEGLAAEPASASDRDQSIARMNAMNCAVAMTAAYVQACVAAGTFTGMPADPIEGFLNTYRDRQLKLIKIWNGVIENEEPPF